MEFLRDIKTDEIKKHWINKLKYNFNKKKEFFSIYVESPFCAGNECKFCCFEPIMIDSKEKQKLKQYYYNIILPSEIVKFSDILRLKNPDAVYFGGGSSSLMDIEEMKLIFNLFQKYTKFKECKEKTFEMNPIQITEEKLNLLKEWNFTHITFGIQTFNDEILKFNKRPLIKDEFYKKITKLIKEKDFCLNIDLLIFIYKNNLKEDINTLRSDILKAVDLIDPENITIFPCYKSLDIKNKKSKTLNKIKKLREMLKGLKIKDRLLNNFDNNPEIEYRSNYFLKKKKWKLRKYNCSAWHNDDARIYLKGQNTIAFGGFNTRQPYSYIQDILCYFNIFDKKDLKYKLFHINTKI